MKSLVTGGAGFIGSHLCEELIARGEEVFVVDDLSTGSLDNVRHLRNNKDFHLVVGSVLDDTVLTELTGEVDRIFHLAAAVGVKLIMDRPVDTIETNVLGTEKVLSLASKHGKKVLVASTSEVYGKHRDHTLSEIDNMVLGPTKKRRWAYACTKALDEFLAFAYHEEKGLPVVVVRFFNTIGPRQSGQYGMVVPKFVKSALLGDPITVFGDGTQSRSFTYVKDAVRAVLMLMEAPAAEGDVFNVGDGREITILELARRVRSLTSSQSEIVFVPYDRAYGKGFEDMERRAPDISKIRKLVGYGPSVGLDEVLGIIIRHMRDAGIGETSAHRAL
ncbi:MAG: GDP-mannose 4,6-dehydratase [Deltaproteobacteria bacterium]|nr:GDP-mannose 4,6-dehydratase [Deltaproteobacteria bacterium]MCL5276820.1 GDP-mannose 4,6-dehydratase [Deltaproteobacteria bacterium]